MIQKWSQITKKNVPKQNDDKSFNFTTKGLKMTPVQKVQKLLQNGPGMVQSFF